MILCRHRLLSNPSPNRRRLEGLRSVVITCRCTRYWTRCCCLMVNPLLSLFPPPHLTPAPVAADCPELPQTPHRLARSLPLCDPGHHPNSDSGLHIPANSDIFGYWRRRAPVFTGLDPFPHNQTLTCDCASTVMNAEMPGQGPDKQIGCIHANGISNFVIVGSSMISQRGREII